MRVNQVSWSYSKTLLRKWPKSFKNINFTYLTKIWLKIQNEKSKLSLHRFLGNIVEHIEAKYHKDQIKTEGAYLTWKKRWRTTEMFASEKLPDYFGSWAEKTKQLLLNVNFFVCISCTTLFRVSNDFTD